MDYKCIKCNKIYSGYQSLWIHNKKFHNNKSNNGLDNGLNRSVNGLIQPDNKIIKSNKQYPCRTCNKIYTTKQSRWSHEKKCKNIEIKEDNIEIKEDNIEIEEEKINEIKELRNEINKLKNEIDKIKNNKKEIINNEEKNSITDGFIYIIHEREFIESNKNIYKIGRTHNTTKRIANYPKNSIYCFFRQSNNMIKDENKLVKTFKDNFIHKNEIGNEYFEGNLTDMIKIINCYLDEN
jgi:hypothetical protein